MRKIIDAIKWFFSDENCEGGLLPFLKGFAVLVIGFFTAIAGFVAATSDVRAIVFGVVAIVFGLGWMVCHFVKYSKK